MKTCPYCAEEIRDEAIRCRYCHAWLVDEHPKDADSETLPASLAGRASSSTSDVRSSGKGSSSEGDSSAIGSSALGSSGIGSSAPSSQRTDVPQATTAQPMTTEPISTSSPNATSSPPAAAESASAASTSATPAASTSATPAAAASPPAADTKIEFTHTGSRYLLGYGADYFGIWDRNAPQQPVERFPRSDQGWAAAWQRYAAIETNWMDLRTGQKSG